VSLKALGMDADELEGIYGCVPRTLNNFDLNRNQLDLQDELGRFVCTQVVGTSVLRIKFN